MVPGSMLKYLQVLDTRSFLTLFTISCNPRLTRLALGLSFTADGWFYFILLPVIILAKPEQPRELITLAMLAFGTERSCYFILKNIIKRPRPHDSLAGVQSVIRASDQFSLPSGHTSAAFLFVTFLCFGISPVFMPMYIWACGVGASRVVLGVHYPADILMGALLGSSVALMVL
jgi:undecaprenyl-diphosphatase